ncbi:SDR family NAD(P)-dependent oxidoreductase [Vibrio sp. 99-8-1]|uniref:SDR family NAD(P)-dependent oxidoreductase n=1 Tax=Vibrio sp. 99-8-1 TaxID=2607602 RepID=UPI001493A593|nr:SDR family NAD(P)-dependent oxidoreductase [Vibrio sp. 99-8-1]NOI65284.1 SDR family NAD(P)-dependent oxidoreductase [Vibrio sp. 99-8-1]
MRVMITGCTSGIGEKLAITYDRQGADVIACGRNRAKLSALAEQGERITPLCFDLTEVDHYPSIDQEIDLLILNAGDCEYIDSPLGFDAKLFERVININLISIGYCLQAWLNNLKQGGRLVLISSSAAIIPLPRAEAYGASKAALSYLANTLSITLKPHNIGVTLVQPGFVDTPLTERNTFAMPMLMDSHQAANKIMAGIEKGKTEINFPLLFVFIMKLFRFLPAKVWQHVATRMA